LRDHAGNTTKTYGFRTNQLNSLNIMEKYWSDDVKAIKIIKKICEVAVLLLPMKLPIEWSLMSQKNVS